MNNSEGQTQEPVGGMKSPQKFLETFEGFDFEEAFTDHELEQITNAMSAYHKYATPAPAPIKTEGEDETVGLFKIYKEALETIANDEGTCCQRCEGNGRLWADGQAHYPSYEGPTIPCGNCGGEGRIYEDIKQIAIDALNSPAPPSPVGIDVEELFEEFDKKWLSTVHQAGAKNYGRDCFKAGYTASLPQSSTEEEKEIKEDRVYSKEELRDMAERFGGFEIP